MRLIDADALDYELGTSDRDIYVRECLAEAQSVTPEPHWIPVTERLPEVKQRVIVQYADGSMAIKRCIDAGHLQWFYSNAVAWMPAPEPYKEVTT
jgi:hypothetical protein